MDFVKEIARKTSCILNKHFKYLNEYVPILTFFLTIGAGAISGIIRYSFYVYNRGIVSYWDLPNEIISIKTDNVIFEVFIYAIFVILILLFNRIVYKRLSELRNENNAKFTRILISCFVFYILSLIIAALVSRFSKLLMLVLILVFVIFTAFYLPAFSICFSDILYDSFEKRKSRKTKDEMNDTKSNNAKEPLVISFTGKIKAILITFILVASIITALIFFHAWLTESQKTEFKVIELTLTDDKTASKPYAILYETDNKYYICPCTIENGTITNINKRTKNVIANEDVEYTLYQYVKK